MREWTPLVLKPTAEDVLGTTFEAYITRHESRILKAGGICKIVLPQQLTPRRAGYDVEKIDISLPKSIRQNAVGTRGLYRMVYIEQKPLTLPEFKAMAMEPTNATPTGPGGAPLEDAELERKFWKNVGIRAPLYGADVEGSLFDDKAKCWNLRHLDTLLSSVLEQAGYKLPGVNTPYLYFGQWRSVFGWHTEDLDLWSVNYIHFGAGKQWYVVPPEHRDRFESVARSLVPEMHRHCPEFLRHKELLLSPQLLDQYQVPYVKVVQHAREFVVVYPGVYHAGFNQGFNCAESVNFATKKWIPIGARAGVCRCHPDAVQIDMRLFRHLVPSSQLPEELLQDSSDEEDEDDDEQEGDVSDEGSASDEEAAGSSDSDDSTTGSLHHHHHHHHHRHQQPGDSRKRKRTGGSTKADGPAAKRPQTGAQAPAGAAGRAGMVVAARGKEAAAAATQQQQHGGMIILEDPYARPRLKPPPAANAGGRSSRSAREGVQTRSSGPARMGVRERVMLRMAGQRGARGTAGAATGTPTQPAPRKAPKQPQLAGPQADAARPGPTRGAVAHNTTGHGEQAVGTVAPAAPLQAGRRGMALKPVLNQDGGQLGDAGDNWGGAPSPSPSPSPSPGSSHEGSSALTQHAHLPEEAAGAAPPEAAPAAASAAARPKRATAGLNPWRQQLSGELPAAVGAPAVATQPQQPASRAKRPTSAAKPAAAPAAQAPSRIATRSSTAPAKFGMALRSKRQRGAGAAAAQLQGFAARQAAAARTVSAAKRASRARSRS